MKETKLTKEEASEWRNHPLTKRVFAEIEARMDVERKEFFTLSMATFPHVSPEIIGVEAVRNAGYHKAIEDIKNFKGA